jgi:hypothetical protein
MGWITLTVYNRLPIDTKKTATQYNIQYIQCDVYRDGFESIQHGQADITSDEYKTMTTRDYTIRADNGEMYKSGRPLRWYIDNVSIMGNKTGLKNALKILRHKYSDKAKNGKLIFSTGW